MSDGIQKLRELSGHLVDPELAIQIFEKMPFAIVLVDASGVIQLVNEQAELMFGYPRGEMFDQPIEMLVPEDVRGKHVENRSHFVADPRTRQMGQDIPFKARSKDGREFSLDIYLAPLVDKRGLFTMAVARRKTV